MEKKKAKSICHLILNLSIALALVTIDVSQNFTEARNKTAQQQSSNKEPGHQIVGYFEVFAPFSTIEDGKVTGTHADVLLSLLKDAGLHVDAQIVPWKRAFQKASVNKNSFVYPVARMPARENRFLWVARLGAICPALLGLKSRSPENSNAENDTRSMSIALVRNDYSAISALEAGLVKRDNVIWVAEHQSMIDLLLKQKVDLIAGDSFLTQSMMTYYKLPNEELIRVQGMSEYHSELYLAANPDIDELILRKLQDTMAKALSRPEGLLQSRRQCSG